MNKKFKKLSCLLSFIFLFTIVGCSKNSKNLEENNRLSNVNNEVSSENNDTNQVSKSTDYAGDTNILEDQYYYSKDDVIDYIHLYKKLPDNYITKADAKDMNWSPSDYTYVIGGDKFGNREGKLPKEKNRQYYEADVQEGYSEENRGPIRIVYSNDGLIFYTEDHYESFERVY
ncbi:MAG: ribonuclease domain-containing protein [Peptoniphilaceae bacterium]